MPKGHYIRVPGSRPKTKAPAVIEPKLEAALKLLQKLDATHADGGDMAAHAQEIRTLLRHNGMRKQMLKKQKTYKPVDRGLPVIFRILHHDVRIVLALFPTKAVSPDKNMCAVYTKDEPHSMGDCDWLLRTSWPAYPRVTREIKAEMVALGYTNLRESAKLATWMLRQRYKAAVEGFYHVPPAGVRAIVEARAAAKKATQDTQGRDMHAAQGSDASNAGLDGTPLAEDRTESEAMQSQQGRDAENALHDQQHISDNGSSTTEGES